MARRLDDLYEEIYKTEDSIQDCIMKKETLESEKISMPSILEILSTFDVIYDKMNATERRDLIKYLIADVQLFNKAEQKVKKTLCERDYL